LGLGSEITLLRKGDALPEPQDGTERPRLIEVTMGEGCVDFPKITEALKSFGYEGWVIVEQDVNQALAVADRFYCLLEGRIALTGVPRDVSKEQITEAYFGMSGRSH